MEEILLTVIVPIYNGEKFLRRCVDSLIQQTYTKVEILLINDGSTDNTKSICEEYEKKDNRVTIINKENEGVSKARNIGIEKAKGKYITFIDADDWIELDTYSKAIKVIDEDNVDIYKFSYVREIGNIKRPYMYKIETNKKIIKKDYEKHIYPYMFSTYDMSSVCLTIFKKSVIKNIKFNTTLKYGEDFLFTTKAILKSDSIYVVPDICYHYICNKESATSKRSIENYIRKIRDIIIANNELINEFEDKNRYLKLKNQRIIKEYEQIIRQVSGESNYKEFKNIINKIRKEIIYPMCSDIKEEGILRESNILQFITFKVIENIKKFIKNRKYR